MTTCHCGAAFTGRTPSMFTLLGYDSPPGHNHDDNCERRTYVCADGHATKVYRRRRCGACEWGGKATCFCHDGEKAARWPDEDGEPVPVLPREESMRLLDQR